MAFMRSRVRLPSGPPTNLFYREELAFSVETRLPIDRMKRLASFVAW